LGEGSAGIKGKELEDLIAYTISGALRESQVLRPL
jgi:hypothetical protein